MTCLVLGVPKSMVFWTRKGIWNAVKKHTPEEIIGKPLELEIVLAHGGTTAGACRRLSISEQAYCRWLKEYGRLKTDQARRRKDLEKEKSRLLRAISDLTLDNLILQ